MPDFDSVSSRDPITRPVPRGILELLVFEVASEEFAIITSAVCEVAAPGQGVGGVGGVEAAGSGNVGRVLDLRRHLGLCPSLGEQRMVVIDGGGEPAGLLVDRICEVVRLSEEMVGPAPVGVSAAQAQLLSGAVLLDERRLLLLSPQALAGRQAGPLAA